MAIQASSVTQADKTCIEFKALTIIVRLSHALYCIYNPFQSFSVFVFEVYFLLDLASLCYLNTFKRNSQ